MKILTSAEIGTRLEAVARAIAPALVAAYVAGYTLGAWLHRTNDQLAAAPKPTIRAAVHKQPLTVEALTAAYTQRELMVMAGTKSKRSKKQLAERILAK